MIDDFKKVREFGGFAARLDREHEGTIAILVGHGWADDNTTHRAAAGLLQHALDARLSRIRHPAALDARTVAADFLRLVMFAEESQAGRVSALREDFAAPLGFKISTLRGHEDHILIDAADDVVKLAPDWKAIAVASNERGILPSHSPFHTAAGDADSAAVRALLGLSDIEIADHLYRGGRLPIGFDAQEIGHGELSRASTGTVVYAFASLPWVDDRVIAPLYEEITAWVRSDGPLAGRYDDNGASQTSWADGLALLALTKRHHLVDAAVAPKRLTNGLFDQQEEGGWQLRTTSDAPRPLFTLYPLLALRRAARIGWLSAKRWDTARRRAQRFLADWLEAADAERPLELIVALRGLQVAQAGSEKLAKRFDTLLSSISAQLLTPGFVERHDEIVRDDHLPLWHASISIPALYLASRHIWGIDHPTNLLLGRTLVDEFDPDDVGWSNDRSDSKRPYTWTTAWGLLASRALVRDIASHWTTLDRWRATTSMQARSTKQPRAVSIPDKDAGAAEAS